ncbi:MAG: hypothetical protein WC000_13050 [Dokdonella sp.]
MFYKMYGATYNDALYSNLIRAGQLTRAESLRRIGAGAGLPLDCIERAMARLNLPMNLIDQQALQSATRL